MNTQARNHSASTDEVPNGAPQTTPLDIGRGHPEYHFVQSVMELHKAVVKIETTLEHVRQTTEETK